MNLDQARASTAAALTRTQVAALLDVDERTVTRAVDEGQLPAIRLGRRVLIPRLPLLALLGAAPERSEAGPASPAIAPNTPEATGVDGEPTHFATPVH